MESYINKRVKKIFFRNETKTSNRCVFNKQTTLLNT